MASLVDMETRKKLISQHPFFVLLKEDEVERLAILFLEKEAKKGDIIVKVGSITDDIYLIVSGKVEVINRIISGNHYTNLPVAVLREGEAIGLAESRISAKQGLRTATIRAITDVVLLCIPLLKFEEFFESSSLYSNLPSIFLQSKVLIFLKQIEPFLTLESDEIQWIGDRVHEETYPRGTVIFNQGDEGDKCYFIERGKVEIIYTDKNGNDVQLDTLNRQDIFGEIAVLTHSPRTATAKVLEDCKLLVLQRKHLQIIINRNKQTHASISTLIEGRNRPLVHSNTKVFQEQAADGEQFWVLRNPKNERFFRLTEMGWFVWQQIDGTNSDEKIYQAFKAKYNSDSDYPKQLLLDLHDQGFIEYSFTKNKIKKKIDAKSPLWRRMFYKRKSHQNEDK